MRRSQGTSRLNHITLHVEVSFLNVNYMISIQCLHASPHAISFLCFITHISHIWRCYSKVDDPSCCFFFTSEVCGWWGFCLMPPGIGDPIVSIVLMLVSKMTISLDFSWWFTWQYLNIPWFTIIFLDFWQSLTTWRVDVVVGIFFCWKMSYS